MTEHPEIEIDQEPDRIPGRPLAVIGAGVIVVILGAALIVVLLGECGARRLRAGHGGMPGDRVPAEINALETEVFGAPTVNERALDQARRHLDSYGWTDPARRRVHVPIDVAIDLYLAEQQRQGQGQGETP